MREIVRPNAISAATASGRRARGFHMNLAVPTQIEQLGRLGFDFVFLDAEHGNFTLTDMENCCRAAELHDLTVVLRVPECNAHVISQALNAGVQGIVVPHVDTVDQARLAIEACRYAPRGLRPSGGARSNGFWRGASDLPAALRETNANVTLSVQIESTEGLAALPGMLALGGIDYLTVGKQDLAQSMGFTRLETGWPAEVVAAERSAAALARAAGVRMKDEVMVLCRINQMLVSGARKFLTDNPGGGA